MDTSVAEVTVTIVEPCMPPKVAEMEAVPVDLEATSPCDPAVLLIVATDVVDEPQVTAVVRSCIILPGYVPRAANCCVVDRAMLGLDGVTAIEARDGLGAAPGAILVPPPPPQLVVNAKTRNRRTMSFDFINSHPSGN